ncbi:Treh [Ramazzottius varieornatus]|uniref:Trehalase n=1 Tax=Ramazzottius varieornatus TaxID=947166 RepID=A0A1D1VLL0_RAMVA|nr:Treh [Ramazzottius varieornatus]
MLEGRAASWIFSVSFRMSSSKLDLSRCRKSYCCSGILPFDSKRRKMLVNIVTVGVGFIVLIFYFGLSPCGITAASTDSRASWIRKVKNVDPDSPCPSQVFCDGPLLQAVQQLHMYRDSKSYVDKPLNNRSEKAVLRNFNQIKEPVTKETLKMFLDENFLPIGSELIRYRPADWKNIAEGGLPLHKNISDDSLQGFAEIIHDKWEKLGRTFSLDVAEHPHRHSLVYVPHPFIVPGGRFREIYYWDSYWVIQGLLVSGMSGTARGMLLNFVKLINRFGHIPNGNRIYYEKRSQPPLLAMMVDVYRKHPNTPPADRDSILKEVLPALKVEHDFWMTRRNVTVKVGGQEYTMNVYRGGIRKPRPESYREDVEHAARLTGFQSSGDFYANVAAACESGQDFSTRWLESPEADFNTMRTEQILPVDLNAFLCAMENLMGQFYAASGDMENADLYQTLALARGDAIHAVFWNETRSMWMDYDLRGRRQKEIFYASHIAPIFARCTGNKVNILQTSFMERVMKSDDLKKISAFPGGFPQSLQTPRASCQWDYPNAWPPSQMMLIEGFALNPDLRKAVIPWAQKWLSAVYTGYKNTGYFFEKYDALNPGKYGGGGEYIVQEGFGWTNGGMLRLLELYPTELTSAEVDIAAPGA